MDFCCDVPKAEKPSRDHWDRVSFVVYPRKVRHLRIEERSPGLIPNARCPKRNSSDIRALRQMKRHEKRVKFRDRAAK
jgi:hypothetical protein